MTTTPPKVSVVCAWYNRADYIRDTVDSLLAQDYPNFDITVVNDGSPDPRVREILESYEDARLRTIHQENKGFTVAISRAVEESDGTLVAIQGAGDLSYPNRLTKQVAKLFSRKDIICIGTGRVERFVGGPLDGKQVYVAPLKSEFFQRDILKSYPVKHGLTHGNLMFWRSSYEYLGGYRSIFVYAQDMDLLLRLSGLGKVAILSDILYERKTFDFDGVEGDIRKTIQQRELAYFARRCVIDSQRHGNDLVDIYGDAAIRFRSAEYALSIFYSSLALRCIANSDVESARLLRDMAHREKISLHAVLVSLILFLSHRSSFFEFLIKRFAQKRFKKHHGKDPAIGYRSLVKLDERD